MSTAGVRVVSGRLAMPDAVDLLKAEIHDDAEAEAIRTELNELYGELENIGVERGQRLLTGEQAKIATDSSTPRSPRWNAASRTPKGSACSPTCRWANPKSPTPIKRLSPDRFRAVLDILATVQCAGRQAAGTRSTPSVLSSRGGSE